MQVDKATEGRRLRKRKEKIPKNLKREANEKEMDGFTKRVLRIPVEKPFDEVYFTHRLWMFFRETKETEEDIRRIFHHVREMMMLGSKTVTRKRHNKGSRDKNLVRVLIESSTGCPKVTGTYLNQPRTSLSTANGTRTSQARSLRSNQACTLLGRSIATEFEPSYVAT
ncbi:hypothetical protein DY000_02020997 [Brassica cretica]|uniref:Uncharacterized protein n=1 Tax=Brassica cretica TaxID=69181 RepID=A0ABQ7E7J1_BRACR|nr:hypothetical protein DY000_02020997 [Brassica cretica]